MPRGFVLPTGQEKTRASLREIPSTKSQIPNKFKIANSNDQNCRATEVEDAEATSRAAAIQQVIVGPSEF
jgi:hypothetical protein